MNKKNRYIIALDQGTTSSRCLIFDENCEVIAKSQNEFMQIYPKSGYVEHDPMEIYGSQYSAMMESITKSAINPKEICSIGIANQRETTIVWDKTTGKPIYNAIVWQCRRTSDIVEQVKKDDIAKYIEENTGVVIDAYFSATKIKWILDNVDGARQKAMNGELLFGTVDTWLVWKLTGGMVHATDYTNASRTMLFNIKTLKWDEKICNYFDIPLSMLPKVLNSSDNYGSVNLFGVDVPICGVAGDQQAALFGQACFDKGDVKNTYGTGCFLLMNTGEELYKSSNGLISTIAIGLNGKVQYALEGSVFVGGAIIQWLRDEMHLIVDASDSEYFANKVKDNNGVYIVPAFTGLGAPYWDMYARGTIIGITRGTNRNHIVRAGLESIAYQTLDLILAMNGDTGIKINELRVDGGASQNEFLIQFQSDITNTIVQRAKIMETTALGAAYLAGLYTGIWSSTKEIKEKWQAGAKYTPKMNENERSKYIKTWHKAVKHSLSWEIE